MMICLGRDRLGPYDIRDSICRGAVASTKTAKDYFILIITIVIIDDDVFGVCRQLRRNNCVHLTNIAVIYVRCVYSRRKRGGWCCYYDLC